MTDESKFVEEIHENKNKNSVHCQFCNSTILKAKAAQYTEIEFKLPLMHQKKKTPDQSLAEHESEAIKSYWTVDDMFTFENIGFSHTVQNTKYLICADCEMGPVGYHDVTSKKCFIALKRVKHASQVRQ